jgi:hypothetical protein
MYNMPTCSRPDLCDLHNFTSAAVTRLRHPLMSRDNDSCIHISSRRDIRCPWLRLPHPCSQVGLAPRSLELRRLLLHLLSLP